jgi:tetratricopeptide (TPR) repeat protein
MNEWTKAEFDQATKQLAEGDSARAVATVEALAEAVASVEGERSPAHAAVLFRAASIYAAAGLMPRAIAALERACRFDVSTADDERMRLTHLMNYGDLLTAAGRLAEAVPVHRASAAARARFYGEDHPGHAFGLDALAAALLSSGEFAEAEALARKASAIYVAHDHPRAPAAAALVIVAICAGGKPPTLEGSFDPIAQAALGLSLRGVDGARARALSLLAAHVEDEDLALRTLAAASTAAAAAGDLEIQVQCLRALAARGTTAQIAVDARLGLGLALGKAGDLVAARAAYHEAIEHARRAGDGDLLSSALRNAGRFLADELSDPNAGALLEEAAKHAVDPEQFGRSACALGIHLQYHGDLAGARRWLVRSLEALPAAHPDAVCARGHLEAVDAGSGCGCGDRSSAIGGQLLAIVDAAYPGAIDAISVGEEGISIRARRALSPDEARGVRDRIELALAEIAQRAERLYG